MPRIHIFDILNQKIDFEKEYDRLCSLLRSNSPSYVMSLYEQMSRYFIKWKYRGTALKFADIWEHIIWHDPIEERVFLLIELIMNFEHAGCFSLDGNDAINRNYQPLKENIQVILDRTGHEIITIEDKLLVVEKRSEATAVAEITNDYQVLEYNHFSLKGDLNKKMAIINHLYKNFEPKRKDLNDKEFQSIYDDYAFLANSFSRHNSEENLKILELTEVHIEQILDNAYDLYLTVILIDNYLNNIKQPVRDLKKSLKNKQG